MFNACIALSLIQMTNVISADQKVKAALKLLSNIAGIKYAPLCVTSKPHE